MLDRSASYDTVYESICDEWYQSNKNIKPIHSVLFHDIMKGFTKEKSFHQKTTTDKKTN